MWVVGGVVLGLLGVWVIGALRSEGPEASAPSRAVVAPPSAPVAAPPPAVPDVASPVAAAEPPDAGAGSAWAPDAVAASDTPASYPIDLEVLRARIPDNLYWKLGAPTKDEQVLRERAREEARWNEQYGKVLSGEATEAEIEQYYAHRRQVSEDYVAFASLVLEQHGARLPEQDKGLYELSIRMHRTRLAEYPRQQEEALARKQAQDTRRREWRGGGQVP